MRLVLLGLCGLGASVFAPACSTGNDDDTGATVDPTTSATGAASSSEAGPDDDGGSTPGTSDDTGCLVGTVGCACAPGDACEGEAICEGGMCQSPAGTDSTGGGSDSGSTGTIVAMCGNGSAEPGDYCLGATSTPFAMGAGCNAVAVGLVDGDDNPDVVVSNGDAATIGYRPGDGSGGFGVQGTTATGTLPVDIGLGDFDDNGTLDAATSNQTSGDVSVLSGMGNGSFGAATAVAIGMTPTGIGVANLDGTLGDDIVVSESTTGMLHVLLAAEAGFGSPVTYPVGTGPTSLLLTDFTGDGAIDALATNGGGNSLSLLLGNGFGQFGPANNANTGATPMSVGAGDCNGDDDTDAIVSNNGGSSLSFLPGNGLGGFGAALPIPVAASPRGVVVA